MEEKRTSKYNNIRKGAIIGSRGRNIIVIKPTNSNKNSSKKIKGKITKMSIQRSSRGCGGCSRRRISKYG